MWDLNDKNGFNDCVKQNVGQINSESMLGQKMINYIHSFNCKKIVEIGTWNGLGSTKCIVNAIKDKDDISFISLECNKEKVEFAKSLYTDISNVKILNSRVIKEIPTIEDMESIFPILKENEQMRYWNTVDLENLKNCDYIELENIDFLLLDGGEFLTYYEFIELKNKCNIIILDDTNTHKNKLVRELLLASSDFKCLDDYPNDRNGWSIFIKK